MKYQLSSKRRVELVEAIPLDFPLSIDFELTNKCNFKCTFCPIGAEDYEGKVGYNRVDGDLVDKIIAELRDKRQKLKMFRFSMFGEALLHPNFDAMLEKIYVAKVSERLEITTNGTTLTPKKIAAILKYPPDILRISIYGLSEAEYYTNTKIKGAYKRVMENLTALFAARKSLGLNKPHIYIKGFEVDSDRKSKMIDLFGQFADEIGFEDGHTWDGSVSSGPPPNSKLHLNNKAVCPLPFYKVVINSNGELTFCCVDWRRETTVGNVNDSTISELFNSPQAIRFRESLLTGKNLPAPCRSCEFFKNGFFVKDNIDRLTLEKFRERMQG